MIRLLLSTAALAGIPIGLAAAYLLVQPAWPHDAIPTAAQPKGWPYPYACCSGLDCRQVGRAPSHIKITERPEGYVISSTGEVVGYQDTRIRQSPDGEFHWCSVAGGDDSRTICLFVPPRGM